MTPAFPPPGLTLRILAARDAPAVADLHDRALTALNRPDWVRPEEPGFFAPVLAEGVSLGLFHGTGLAGYALLQGVLEQGDDPPSMLGPSGAPFAKLCGCTIAAPWRGHGLQAALAAERLRLGRARGFSRFFATAAPGNAPSWISLLRAGMTIAILGHKYGDALRYTLVQDEGRPEGPVETPPAGDLAAQAELLAQGWRGVSALNERIVFRRWVTP